MGFAFLLLAAAWVTAVLFLAGSLCFLSAASTVKEFIRLRVARKETDMHLLAPPALGIVLLGVVSTGQDLVAFAAFLALLTLASVRALERRERQWQTRVAFTAAVVMLALFGLFASGTRVSLGLTVLVFAVPFTFFSSQELLVQHLVETLRSSNVKARSPEFRKSADESRFVLYSLLTTYAVASGATGAFASSLAFPVLFEVLLVSFPAIWFSSRGKLNFLRLGIGAASLSGVMSLAVILLVATH